MKILKIPERQGTGSKQKPLIDNHVLPFDFVELKLLFNRRSYFNPYDNLSSITH